MSVHLSRQWPKTMAPQDENGRNAQAKITRSIQTI